MDTEFSVTNKGIAIHLLLSSFGLFCLGGEPR